MKELSLDETIRRLKEFRKKLSTDFVKDLGKVVGVDTVSQIEMRVRDRQKKADGQSFSRYSTNPMLTSGTTVKSRRVWQSMASSKSKRRNLDWVTIKKGGKNIHLFELKGGYAQLRKLEGFSNANKSFEFTGEMWRKFGVKKTTVGNGVITFTLGGKTTAAQDKIDWNSEREGVNIIEPCKDEVLFLQNQINRLLPGYLAKVGL